MINCFCSLHPLPPAGHYAIMVAIFAYATPLHLKISLHDDALCCQNEHFLPYNSTMEQSYFKVLLFNFRPKSKCC